MRYCKLRLETHNLINHHTPTFLDLGQLLSIACNIDGYSFVAKLFSSLCLYSMQQYSWGEAWEQG